MTLTNSLVAYFCCQYLELVAHSDIMIGCKLLCYRAYGYFNICEGPSLPKRVIVFVTDHYGYRLVILGWVSRFVLEQTTK